MCVKYPDIMASDELHQSRNGGDVYRASTLEKETAYVRRDEFCKRAFFSRSAEEGLVAVFGKQVREIDGNTFSPSDPERVQDVHDSYATAHRTAAFSAIVAVEGTLVERFHFSSSN